MKTRFIALFVSLLLPVSLVHADDEDTPVDIPDWGLRIMITAHLKKTRDATITVSDMEKLYSTLLRIAYFVGSISESQPI